MEDLVAYIANKSNGMKIDIPLSHPKEQEMAAVGEALFYRRGGVNDFSCSTCHAEEGKRIRLQGLPDLSKPGKQPQETMGGWPTYRVSQGALRTMQHRLWDCYRQQRWPVPEYASDALTALTVFFTTAVLYLFGGKVLEDMAFVLTVGVVTGTFSTVYIAGSLIVDWQSWRQRWQARKKKVVAKA